jgi:hypothetical protein
LDDLHVGIEQLNMLFRIRQPGLDSVLAFCVLCKNHVVLFGSALDSVKNTVDEILHCGGRVAGWCNSQML